jgi:hypothetical protein
MLADMGIEVWSLRTLLVHRESVTGMATEPPLVATAETIAVSEAVPAEETVPAKEIVVVPEPRQPSTPSMPGPVSEQASTNARSLAVTYLVCGSTVMLVDNTETGLSRRLCRDLLAAAATDWLSVPREIAFSWPGGGPQADGWRAFRAFVEKQLSDTEARLALCSEGLAAQLIDLVGDCELLVLPALGDLDVEAKRALWRRMQTLGQ